MKTIKKREVNCRVREEKRKSDKRLGERLNENFNRSKKM